jgi:hypothetical protein
MTPEQITKYSEIMARFEDVFVVLDKRPKQWIGGSMSLCLLLDTKTGLQLSVSIKQQSILSNGITKTNNEQSNDI